MKTRFLVICTLILIGGPIPSWFEEFTGQEFNHTRSIELISSAFGQCVVNDDWPDAPCLDTIVNGRYDQKDVDRWTDYYQYKGTVFMEQKRSELEQAIKIDNLQNWVNESTQNRNVYEYYFFSGRAPNIVGYDGKFVEFMIKESSTIHDPYLDDESLRLAANKIGEYTGGGSGTPIFDISGFQLIPISIGILVGIGSFLGVMIFWRKRK